MSSFVLKMRRGFMRVANKLTKIDRSRIHELSRLMAEPPSKRGELSKWSADVKTLIQMLIVDRIAKEDLAIILAGIISYRKTGVTPEMTQHALVRGYENSSGLLQEVLHKVLFENYKPEREIIRSTLFGEIGPESIQKILSDMSQDGYSVLPFKLDSNLIERINADSLQFDYQLKGGDSSAPNEVAGLDLTKPPPCVSAYAKPDSISGNAMLQTISQDELFKEICASYLGTQVNLIDSTFWYTFPSEEPSAETAQLFHYDLDTIRWVKIFVYLTDVDENSGPHEYVATSHKPENKASEILVRNYARLDDLDIDKYYADKRRVITAPAGTVIIGDTRCFHKGNAVGKGHRLIYSPIYAPSRLGYFHG